MNLYEDRHPRRSLPLAQLFSVLDRANNGICSDDPDAGGLVGQESNATVVVKYGATSIAA